MYSYKQLTQEQRYGIYLTKTGHNQIEIASMIGVHKPIVSRELCLNHGERGYRSHQAHPYLPFERGSNENTNGRLSDNAFLKIGTLLPLAMNKLYEQFKIE